eukprot:SAG31_NODE_3211_length_4548_cov_3.394695_2_plen_130_part_00
MRRTVQYLLVGRQYFALSETNWIVIVVCDTKILESHQLFFFKKKLAVLFYFSFLKIIGRTIFFLKARSVLLSFKHEEDVRRKGDCSTSRASTGFNKLTNTNTEPWRRLPGIAVYTAEARRPGIDSTLRR